VNNNLSEKYWDRLVLGCFGGWKGKMTGLGQKEMRLSSREDGVRVRANLMQTSCTPLS